MRCILRLVCVSLLALGPCGLLWGQGAATTGTMTGRVTDASGGVIPGATVTVTDTATKEAKTVATNREGLYILPDLPPSTYDVTVSKQGFKEAAIVSQQLIVGQSLTINVTLEVGAATQTVEVRSTPGAELQTLNSTMGTTLGGDTILTLPNQNRDATTLLVFQPTTAPTFGGAEGNVMGGQVAGSMSDQNTFTLDGGDSTSDLEGDNNYVSSNRGYVGPQAAIPTPVESIEEFKVATNNQTADFSSSAGGQVMLVTKRGTNTWHGSAYDYFQADWLDAAGWDADVINQPKVKQHQNRFGGSIGGPLSSKNFLGGRTYIYGNYEGRRYPYANSTYERAVPSLDFRSGILQLPNSSGQLIDYNLATSTQCGPNGGMACDPRGIGLGPTISQLWNKYEPAPNDCKNSASVGGDNLNICGYVSPLVLPIRDDFFVTRLDHDFGDRWRFMASYRFFRLVEPTTDQVDIGGVAPGDTLGVPASKSSDPAQPRYFVAGLTGNLTPTLTNDFHWSYLRNDWNWIRYGVPNGLLGVPGGIEVGGETGNSLDPLDMQTQQTRFRTWNGHDYSYTDSLNWLKGNHFFQMGGTARHWWDNHVRNDNVTGSLTSLVYQIDANSQGLVEGANYQPPVCSAGGPVDCITSKGAWWGDYAEGLGMVGAATQLFPRAGTNFQLTGLSYLQDHSITDAYSLFFNDSFKIKPNLTLNYGLEWGVQMPPYEENGIQDYMTDTEGNPIPYSSYVGNRVNAANQGQVYNPIIGFEPIRAVGGSPKYPFQPYYGGFAPRASIAWSPRADSGLFGKLFGVNKTVIRGGYARIYDRNNAVDMVLTPLLGYGFGQPVECLGANMSGTCGGPLSTTPANAFRIGVDGNTAPFPSVSSTLPVPAEPGVNTPGASVLFALDNRWRPGVNDEIDFSIQREIPGQMIVEMGYVGKWSRDLYLGMDMNGVPTMMKLGGQTLASAYYQLELANKAGTAPNAVAPQPFFETALGGSAYCKGYSSCTAAVLANEGPSGTGNLGVQYLTGIFADIDTWNSGAGAWNFPGCMGCNILPSDQQGLAAVDTSTTKGYANYQAGFLTVQKRTGHGLTLSGNLTWSHTMDTDGINQEYVEDSPNNIYNLAYDYSNSPFDRRWVANILAYYQLPFGKGQRFATSSGVLDKIIGGWSFAPIFTWGTGLPIETYTGSCGEVGQGYIPWCAGAAPMANTGSFGHSPHLAVKTNCVVGAYNDPACGFGGTGANLFADPAAVYNDYRPMYDGLDTSTYDDGPYYGQSRWNLDFTLAKQTRFTERMGATFYAQFLNSLNHMEYADPGSGSPAMNLLSPQTWGTLTTQYNSPRTIELGLRVYF
jgi:Carboxypeptidase regulatory-like domain